MASQFKRDGIFQSLLMMWPLLFALPFIALAVLLTPGLIVGHLANPHSPVCYLGVAIILTGLALLIKAKWPQLRKLEFMTFGVPNLPKTNRRDYFLSYGFMLAGFAIVAASGKF